jgi:hypothetical protein
MYQKITTDSSPIPASSSKTVERIPFCGFGTRWQCCISASRDILIKYFRRRETLDVSAVNLVAAKKSVLYRCRGGFVAEVTKTRMNVVASVKCFDSNKN